MTRRSSPTEERGVCRFFLSWVLHFDSCLTVQRFKVQGSRVQGSRGAFWGSGRLSGGTGSGFQDWQGLKKNNNPEPFNPEPLNPYGSFIREGEV